MQRVDPILAWRALVVPLVLLIVSVCQAYVALVATIMAWCDFMVPFHVWPGTLVVAAGSVVWVRAALFALRRLFVRLYIWRGAERGVPRQCGRALASQAPRLLPPTFRCGGFLRFDLFAQSWRRYSRSRRP